MSEECVHDRCLHTCADCGAEVGTESHDEAYHNGREDEQADWLETVEDKDLFIEGQGLLIEAMMAVITEANAWRLVPDDVFERLRDYV